jgi:3-methyladenine DNA glycosylase AlkD
MRHVAWSPIVTPDLERGLTADRFIQRLAGHRSDEELRKYGRYFKTGPGEYGEADLFMGVRMGTVFALAAEFAEMSLDEIERLLESKWHEARAGALRIMATQARGKRSTREYREALARLYLRRHDRIDSWDLVDLAAWHVLGRWLVDQPRDVLYSLAASENFWERRSAILATLAFIPNGDLDDAFALATILLHDEHDLVQKAVGWALRECEPQVPARLHAFLDEHAATMPRTALRYAIERMPPDERKRYLAMRP